MTMPWLCTTELWQSTGTREVVIADKTLSSGVAQATITSQSGGYAQVRVTATYSDGNVENVYLEITIEDRETRG